MQILETYLPSINNIAYIKTGNYHDAKDLTQDVCLRILKNKNKLEAKPLNEQVKIVNRLIQNLFIDNIRAKKEVHELQPNYSFSYTAPNIFKKIELKELQKKHRLLYDYENGYDIGELSGFYNLPKNEVVFKLIASKRQFTSIARKKWTRGEAGIFSTSLKEKMNIFALPVITDLNKKVTTKQLADLVGLPAPSFHIIFKRIFSCSWTTMRKRLLMKTVKERLCNGEKIGEILASYNLGIRSDKFYRSFNKHFGCSPKHFYNKCAEQPQTSNLKLETSTVLSLPIF